MSSPRLLMTAALALTAVIGPGHLSVRAADKASAPPLVTTRSPVRIWVDQIGYRTAGRKLVIVAADNPLPKPLPLEVWDAKTLQPVWSRKDHPEAVTYFNDNQKDPDSGDFVAQLDLTELNQPGRYFVVIHHLDHKERSCSFAIADDPYHGPARAAWRVFYYQRADTAKPEKYAGPWNHPENHVGPNQATMAKVYKWTGGAHFDPVGKEVLDATPRDVRGGWWDAGDFNKYTGNTTRVHNGLLFGIQLLGDACKDEKLNIPESGNGYPDVLNEVRYTTEYFLRLADDKGACFGKVHELGSCPPEADKSPVQLSVPTSGATMHRAAALAYAALVWQERQLDPAFAKKCLAASRQSWDLLKGRPHPWPADPKDSKKQAYTGEWFLMDYNLVRAFTAACYFRLTGEAEFGAIVKTYLARFTTLEPSEESTQVAAIAWQYAHSKGADADTVRHIKQVISDGAEKVVQQTGSRRAYAIGIKGYWWGSNALVGQTAVTCLAAAELTDDPVLRKRYRDAAEEYIHYLLGRNPLGICYLTNMKEFGAENSVMVMFHSWLGNPTKEKDPYGSRFIGAGAGKIGPPPGYVVGGANGSMKRYVATLDWRQNAWEYNEPDIHYQAPCAILLLYAAEKGR